MDIQNDPGRKSIMEQIALLPPEEQEAVLAGLDMEQLQWDWSMWSRPNQVPPKDDSWDVGLFLGGRGVGKLLKLDTPIRTPQGWKAIGDIETGDQVFDENGSICQVVQAHTPETPKKMYRLTFSDGTTLDAGEEHQWVTWTAADRKSYNRSDSPRQKKVYDSRTGFPENWPVWTRYDCWGVSTGVGPKVRTTQDIVDTLTYGKRGDLNHSIPLSRPLSLSSTELALDPYIFGIWLGDGSSAGATITQHRDDVPYLVSCLVAQGFKVSVTYPKEISPDTARIDISRGLKTKLNALGVVNNKNIPWEYLNASEEDRRALLAGLMDSDGSMGRKNGMAEFCTTSAVLAENMLELIRSLGEKPVMKKSNSFLYGAQKKDRYRITWRPLVNPFCYERKASLFRPLNSQALRHYHRMIVSVEEITPVLSRCLTVDSPNSMYLAGEALIPTHNTRAAAEWVREKAKITNEGPLRFLLVARTAADVREVIVEGEALSLDTEVATPTGFIPMRDIKEGDIVLGGDGRPCSVTRVFPVLNDRPVYDVNIGGTVIKADAQHKWLTSTHVERDYEACRNQKYEDVRTTEEIVATLKTTTGYSVSNHAVRVSAVVGAHQELPIQPYTLGVWLGDGTAKGNTITSHTDDQPIVRALIESEGYRTTENKTKFCFGVKTLTTLIKQQNLYKNKHIPEVYFHSSLDQRMSLLRGLLDTDGCVSERGQIEFTNTNKELADGVLRLVSSLGIKAKMTHKLAGYSKSMNSSALYRIRFRTSLPVFGLARKQERLSSKTSRDGWRYIESITPTGTVPVRCISVDSEDSTFLITRQYIKTHNSGILAVSPPSERPEYRPSIRRLIWPNGNQAFCTSADEPDSLRGVQARLALDTPLPTTKGWKTMGSVEVGDYVFDEMGAPTRVSAVYPIHPNPESYRVTFSDGTHIDADAGHRWGTITASNGYKVTPSWGTDILQSPHFALSIADQKMLYDEWKQGVKPAAVCSVLGLSRSTVYRWHARFRGGFVPPTEPLRVSTVEIKETLKYGRANNHYIPALPSPLVYDDKANKKLPLDPWVLGLVLGDGATRQPGTIASNKRDIQETIDKLTSKGYPAVERKNFKIAAAGVSKIWGDVKSIPPEYFVSSPENRLELLRGLTDSGGTVDSCGAYRFYNTNYSLIEGYAELCRSLGLIPRIYRRPPRGRRGVFGKESWFVQVFSHVCLVSLSGKGVGKPPANTPRHHGRFIVSVEPISSVPMRCIMVEADSHLYIAGTGMVATSNSYSWGDEIAAWRQPTDTGELSAWDNLRIATRLGRNPQIFATTTPKRVQILFDLLEEQKKNHRVWVSRGSTFENAGNLSQAYLDAITGVYEGTSLARQELYGEMLDAVEGALWDDEIINSARVGGFPGLTPLRIIGVDPSVAENPGDECGIVVCAATAESDLYKRHAWVLEDASIKGSPTVWAQEVVRMANRWGCPVVAEVNQGGALVRNAIHQIDPSVVVLEVHSKFGKKLRAEPITLAYQQKRVHHVGYHTDLETQMITWDPESSKKSPDRVDALVHGLTALLINPPKGFTGSKVRAHSFADRRINTKTKTGLRSKLSGGSSFRIR